MGAFIQSAGGGRWLSAPRRRPLLHSPRELEAGLRAYHPRHEAPRGRPDSVLHGVEELLLDGEAPRCSSAPVHVVSGFSVSDTVNYVIGMI